MHEKIIHYLIKNGIDYFIEQNVRNIKYLTGFKGDGGILLIDCKKRCFKFLTDFRYIEKARQEVFDIIKIVQTSKNYYVSLKNEIKENNSIQIGLDGESTSYNIWQLLQSNFSSATLIELTSPAKFFRRVKNRNEIEIMKKAAEIADSAFVEVQKEIYEGITERKLAAALEYNMRLLGAQKASFDVMVLFGRKSSQPHGVPGNDILMKNMPILFDFGAEVDGYCSDMTRMVWFGKDIDSEFKNIFEIVLNAQIETSKYIKVGRTGEECDLYCRKIFEKDKVEEYFGHGLGHGVGMDIHEDPYLARAVEEKLEKGNVVTVEPGLYFPGKFGVRIEDTVLIGESGIELVFTKTDKNIIIIN